MREERRALRIASSLEDEDKVGKCMRASTI